MSYSAMQLVAKQRTTLRSKRKCMEPRSWISLFLSRKPSLVSRHSVTHSPSKWQRNMRATSVTMRFPSWWYGTKSIIWCNMLSIKQKSASSQILRTRKSRRIKKSYQLKCAIPILISISGARVSFMTLLPYKLLFKLARTILRISAPWLSKNKALRRP